MFIVTGYLGRQIKTGPDDVIAKKGNPKDIVVIENSSTSLKSNEQSLETTYIDNISYVKTSFQNSYENMAFDIATKATDNMIVKITKQDPELLSKALPVYSYIQDVRPSLPPHIAAIQACSIVFYSKENSLPIGVVVALIQLESGFRPNAVSNVGATGLMQVMWKYHYGRCQSLGIMTQEELKDPEKGIRAGTAVLKGYIKAEKSLIGGLKRYYGTLSPSYVSTFNKYWHAFELFKSGIENDWKVAATNEKHYWDTLQKVPSHMDFIPKTDGNAPVINKPGSIGIIRSDGSKATKNFTANQEKKSSIVIRFDNGKVKTWSD